MRLWVFFRLVEVGQGRRRGGRGRVGGRRVHLLQLLERPYGGHPVVRVVGRRLVRVGVAVSSGAAGVELPGWGGGRRVSWPRGGAVLGLGRGVVSRVGGPVGRGLMGLFFFSSLVNWLGRGVEESLGLRVEGLGRGVVVRVVVRLGSGAVVVVWFWGGVVSWLWR